MEDLNELMEIAGPHLRLLGRKDIYEKLEMMALDKQQVGFCSLAFLENMCLYLFSFVLKQALAHNPIGSVGQEGLGSGGSYW